MGVPSKRLVVACQTLAALLIVAAAVGMATLVLYRDGTFSSIRNDIRAEKGGWEASLVIPRLYVGSVASARDWDGLESHGITAVLNAVAIKFPNRFPDAFETMNVKLVDHSDQDLISYLPVVTRWLTERLQAGHTVLVHCEEGRSRSTSMVLAYLMSSQGIGYVEANEILEEARPILRLNHGFKDQLKTFDELLQTHGPAVPQEAVTPAMVEGLVPGEGYSIAGGNPTTARENLYSFSTQSTPDLWLVADFGGITACLVAILAALILMGVVALITITTEPRIMLLQEIHCENEGDDGIPDDVHLSADQLV